MNFVHTPLAEFFGNAVIEHDGWRVYVGRAGEYASRDGLTALDLRDYAVPDAVRRAFAARQTTPGLTP